MRRRDDVAIVCRSVEPGANDVGTTAQGPRCPRSPPKQGSPNGSGAAICAVARGFLNADTRFGSTVLRCRPPVNGSSAHMNKTKRPTQQGDVWSWVVIGLVLGVVTVALYGPFIWELTHSV
jgi:hypothetical protein